MRRIALLGAALAAVCAPVSAFGHPLGNFTVNRFAAVEVSGDRVYVRYVLDLAEIPALQEGARVRAAGFPREVAGRLELTVDGRRARLVPLDSRTQDRPGAGGLPTLRFEAVYDGGRAGRSLGLHDRNFAARIGWREVVVRARDGARVLTASVPARSESDELRAYPQDLLRSPPGVASAQAQVEPGEGPGVPPTIGAAPAPERSRGGFAALVLRGDLSPGVIGLALLAAAFWGAAHAFSPGHGKAIVAGYLVGTRGRPRDALVLGLIVTATHTAGVFALGGVTLLLSAFIVPEQLYPWLNLVSALLVVGVGLAILRWRIRAWRRGEPLGGDHHHSHSHGHSHGHHHDHGKPGEGGRGGLLGIGISAGIIPCPTALVVMLAAISLQRVGYGLVLIVAFSVGLAVAVTGIGLIAVTARRAFSRMSFDGPAIRALPAVSAVVVLGLGVVMTLRALPPLL